MPVLNNLIERYRANRADRAALAALGEYPELHVNGDPENEPAAPGPADDAPAGDPAGAPASDPEPAPANAPAGDPAADPAPVDAPAADPGDAGQAAAPADVATLCHQRGFPSLAASFIEKQMSLVDAGLALDDAVEITAMVAAARAIQPAIDPQVASTLIAVEASPLHARAHLFDKLVAMQTAETPNLHLPDNRPAGGANDHGWGAIVAKGNARRARTTH